ncbi:hypothetical protein E4U13_003032 [Claviceps humidiphila]|uniref:Uncharacterized protein n=1 Tax=Claviceps humidiphila TaxID=1294629 RepID=A0A9P7Q6W4_9HYPO|nr:hypothetical protein E4U13_003032 [Claviceps humidiphila]
MVLGTMTIELTNRLLRRHPDHEVSDGSGRSILRYFERAAWQRDVQQHCHPLAGYRGRISQRGAACRRRCPRRCGRRFVGKKIRTYSEWVADYEDVSNYVHAGHVENE